MPYSVEKCDISINDWFGFIFNGYGDYVYLHSVGDPVIRVDLLKGKIDTIGRPGVGPGEYGPGVGEIHIYGDRLFISDLKFTKILIYDAHKNTFIREIPIPCMPWSFRVLNDSIMIVKNPAIAQNIFIRLNYKKGKVINRFGKAIPYPSLSGRKKLQMSGGYSFATFLSWDVRDSILIGYDYFNDRLIIYNIENGEEIGRFGRKHRGWSLPRISLSGNRYVPTKWRVAPDPCYGVFISDEYIYVVLGRDWINKWWARKPSSLKESEKIYTSHYYMIDVYSRSDFRYIGTCYPLDSFSYCEGEYLMRLWNVSLSSGDTLNFYFQVATDKYTKFRRVSVKVEIPDSLAQRKP